MGRAARVALQLWIVLFVVFFGTENVLQEPTLRVVAQVLFGLPLVAWALLRLRGVDSVVDVAIGVGLALYLLVALLGRDPVGSLETLGLVLGFAILYRAARDAATSEEWRARVVVAGATGLAITLALNAWLLIDEKLAWIRAGGGVPELEGTQVFPWETVNVMPVLVLLAIPFVYWVQAGRLRALLAVVVGASALVVVPLSAGRAGWGGLLVMAVAFVLLRPVWRPPLPAGRWSRAAVLATAGVVVVAVGLVVLSRGLAGTARVPLWEQTLTMAADSPLLGSGPSTYSWVRFEFGPPEARFIAVRLTHNVVLQTLADGGAALLLALGLVVAAWCATLWRGWGSVSRGGRLGAAALLGLAAAYQLDDFSFLPAVTALAVVIAAFALPPAAARPQPIALRWAPLALAVVVAAVSLPAVGAADMARLASASGRVAALDGRWSDAEAAFERAADARSGMPLYWVQLGYARSQLGDTAGAWSAYLRGSELAPGDPRPFGALAELAPEGEHVDWLRRAADLTNGDVQYAYRLGLALAADGQPAAAAEAWGRVVAVRSALFSVLPYTDAGIDADAVAAAAPVQMTEHPSYSATLDELGWDIGLAGASVPEDAPSAWQAIQAALDGDLARARDLADAAVAASPYDARSYAAVAAVARFECDLAAEEGALELWSLTHNAAGPTDADEAPRREFVYREATLGPMQPPSAARLPDVPIWPWGLVPMPECGE